MPREEIVLVSDKPVRVHEEIKDGKVIHYFYWHFDLYKPYDYEPVNVREIEGGVQVLTRVHWTGLVLWNSPRVLEGKPLVTFVGGVHTPIIISENWDYYVVSREELDIAEKLALKFLLTFIELMKLHPWPEEIFKDYGDLIVEEPPPPEYEFDLSHGKYVVIVGVWDERAENFVEEVAEKAE